VQTLDGVGRVDDSAHLRRECKERNHFFPAPSPARCYGRVFFTPGTFLEGVELGRCCLGMAAE
jgi:hypothetical protein